jgi:hypothetical protein
MKRHWDRHIGAVENLGTSGRHEPGDGPRERTATAVLEGVNDLPERSVVAAGASRHGEVRRVFAATITDRGWPFDCERLSCTQGGQGIAADRAQWRRNANDGAPARVTDRARKRPLEHTFATGACRRKQRAHETVRCRGPDRQTNPRCARPLPPKDRRLLNRNARVV